MKLATWNMQGSSHSTENKWNEGVNNIIGQLGVDVFCLQECGAVPSSATGVGELDGIALYQWGGTDRNAKWILFYPWDTHGNRCNLAVVVKAQYNLDHAAALYPDSGPAWRPILGVQFNHSTFFSIHAISPGGPDASGLLAKANASGGGNWVVAGDFNRSPDSDFPSGSWSVCPPAGNTYPSTNPEQKLDFAVRNATSVQGEVLSLFLSDHLPVVYTFT